MLLRIATTHRPATDLGYLLHKNPGALSRKALSFGEALVFAPEATEDRCTVALMVNVDPVGLVRGKGAGEGAIDAYVNDRPYVASSFLSVAIAEVFGTALNGSSKERQELADTAIPLEAIVPAVRVPGEGTMAARLFEPLGYAVEATRLPLDETFPAWGASTLHRLVLRGTVRLRDLLRHLYILLPALDADPHHWIGDAEVEKLVAKGDEWLPAHPAKELIASRYLRRRGELVTRALDRLALADDSTPEDAEAAAAEPLPEPKQRLHDVRLDHVAQRIRAVAPSRVIDLGCGEGKLLGRLAKERGIAELAGMDISLRALEIAARRLHLDDGPQMLREKVRLFQGSLLYVDDRLEGFDAAALVEVIEHIDESRLPAMERVLFERARPRRIVITTPNADYNVRWETLSAGATRHEDHRFEWTRAQFEAWARACAARFGYRVAFEPIGEVDAEVGAPSQMAVFDLGAEEVAAP